MRISTAAAATLFGISFVLSLPGAAHAQAAEFDPFRVDFGIGYAQAPAQKSYGMTVSVEPKFNILDQVALGGRFEGVVMGGGNIGPSGSGDVSVKEHIAAATLAKGDFFLTRSAVRPWVGLGAGFYTLVGQDTATNSMGASVDQRAGRYFGVAPQLGLEMGGFRIAATYNAIFGADVEVHQQVGGNDSVKKYSQNYATVDLGFRIGGRRHRNPPTM